MQETESKTRFMQDTEITEIDQHNTKQSPTVTGAVRGCPKLFSLCTMPTNNKYDHYLMTEGSLRLDDPGFMLCLDSKQPEKLSTTTRLSRRLTFSV